MDNSLVENPIKFIQGTYGKISQDSNGNVDKEIKKYRKEKWVESTSIKEVSFLSSIFHKNIIHLNLITINQNTININLKYGGITIDEWCKITPVERRIKYLPFIIFQLLEVLCFLEIKSIIHGDIKPRNILINKETYQIMIIDFGAVHFDYNIIRESVSHKYFSNCTYPFSSPEMLSFDNSNVIIKPNLSPNHDIFSLGLVVKYILTGSYDDEDEKIISDSFLSTDVNLCIKLNLNFEEDSPIYKLLKNIKKLLNKMLVIDSKKRPYAKELIDEELFYEYKKKIISEHIEPEINNPDSNFQNLIYLKKNSNITYEIRSKLVEWIFEVCDHCDFVQIALLATSIFDRFIYKLENTTPRYAHIACCSCILLSDSLINNSQISFETIIDITDPKFNIQEIKNILDKILITLDCRVYFRTFDCILRDKNIRINYNIIERICRSHENIFKSNNELIDIYITELNKKPTLDLEDIQ